MATSKSKNCTADTAWIVEYRGRTEWYPLLGEGTSGNTNKKIAQMCLRAHRASSNEEPSRYRLAKWVRKGTAR